MTTLQRTWSRTILGKTRTLYEQLPHQVFVFDAKDNCYHKVSLNFFIDVFIAMPSISPALCYSLHIFIKIIIVQHIDFLIRVKHIPIL